MLVCVIIGVIVYCTWTGGDQETTMDVTGNKNVVMASEKREISLFRIYSEFQLSQCINNDISLHSVSLIWPQLLLLA